MEIKFIDRDLLYFGREIRKGEDSSLCSMIRRKTLLEILRDPKVYRKLINETS